MDIFIYFIFTIIIFSILWLIKKYYYLHPNALTFYLSFFCYLGVSGIYNSIAVGAGYLAHTTPFIHKILVNNFIQNISWIFFVIAVILMPFSKVTNNKNKE